MSTAIRPFQDTDAAHLFAIYRNAVTTLAKQSYTPIQIEAWCTLAPDADRWMALYGDGRTTFIAVDGADRPVGFSDLERNGHVGFLYVAPGHAGRGIGSALLHTVEQEGGSLGLPRLFSEVSEAALRVFVRAGYRRGARRDLLIGGVPIHNWAVEKDLEVCG